VVSAQHTRLGRYEIIGSLARGRMVELFLAQLPEDAGLAKHVVIKRVLPELATDRALVDRFLAEARIAAALDHQNLVHVHDIGHDDDGQFFAMERLHGGDVASILSVVTRLGGGLPLAFAIEIARAACAGLHYAHDRRTPSGEPLGLVHRNVSPQNLFVTFDGAVKLLDFGLAKPLDFGLVKPLEPTPSSSQPGVRQTRATYLSPEQEAGEPLDRRSDVYSLAAVLWEMTVGEPPCHAARGSMPAIAKALVGRELPRPSATRPGYPPELERVVMRGLGRDPAARYQTAGAMQAALEAVARTTSLVTSPRELALFMAAVFPGRLKAWQGSERRITGPHAIAPRATMLLPSEPLAAPVSRPDIALPPVPLDGELAAGRGPRIRRATALAVVALAAVIVVVMSGRSRALDADLAAVAGPVSAVALAPDHLIGEDAHWFEVDDYLVNIHGRGYDGDRLDDLIVARMARPPRSPGGRTWFTDTNGKGIDSEHYFRTRVAARVDLALGAIALCHAHRHERRATTPSNRNTSLSGRWMLGRVTEISRLDAGLVSVANVECEIAGVRVLAR
jgi:serine/threonine-protein kinase